MSTTDHLTVDLSTQSYTIHVGAGVLNDVAAQLLTLTSGRQVMLVSDTNVYGHYGQPLIAALQQAGFTVATHILLPGEEQKSWPRALDIIDDMVEQGLNRDATMVALGGGVVGDLAGFVASIYQRGINYVQVPTTLLAQVDSSVGGKVAVNHPKGKNLIGNFHHPLAVWADTDTFTTLPKREWHSGLAEVVKYGVIADATFFTHLEDNLEAIGRRNASTVQHIVTTCCRLKAHIVAQDAQERGQRKILNLGHTVGHAIENVADYGVYRHGEGIAMGMVAATALAIKRAKCSPDTLHRLKRLLQGLGLPISLPKDLNIQTVLEALQLDKKVERGQLVFILPTQIGEVEISKGISLSSVKKVLEELQQ